MTVLSVFFGIASALAGLFFSYLLDIPSGATIVLCQTCIFIGCLLGCRVVGSTI